MCPGGGRSRLHSVSLAVGVSGHRAAHGASAGSTWLFLPIPPKGSNWLREASYDVCKPLIYKRLAKFRIEVAKLIGNTLQLS